MLAMKAVCVPDSLVSINDPRIGEEKPAKTSEVSRLRWELGGIGFKERHDFVFWDEEKERLKVENGQQGAIKLTKNQFIDVLEGRHEIPEWARTRIVEWVTAWTGPSDQFDCDDFFNIDKRIEAQVNKITALGFTNPDEVPYSSLLRKELSRLRKIREAKRMADLKDRYMIKDPDRLKVFQKTMKKHHINYWSPI
ncbi:TPA: hypothetical protein DDW69_01445 [candidate division CPR2 bacterium]|uniref:Uncharacterized protein n=1 Tax=candidate division CPR2 bacterium GW2011_GWC1_41_48 TaxID=1618344 RepID=A0A0G0YJI8_UNCC2|nr:MAG: hypothetical protein UT47_C0001G0091 [candidate division CPR2 bacterium GW2011_GWC2_39_35]KKR28257.1 MAG: hypothetical protein UT59_C0031G0004 [candidate division CPR2 bacterium GW2011_GWD1_39_7]KKS09686.1 MAG: hypothetical protein UU65_C0001G0091 [candidate division CPR2 bacterium GW2011_GWC1_41_48]OGB60452.1 MAG: hypothetical protein A2Y27_01330 [candidate division CPR2 bacterium GWD1_39_7]HBG81484.1 hypothetical protein [candidate division CPR2 bacterium]